ncbi:hypothetical protein [Micromonospora sp. NPDC007230]|uniref:hypothetical protein n=1 Tax=Micromonospora sp. NPDC007230 TaxID=3364237 RepID=UPI0036B0D79A
MVSLSRAELDTLVGEATVDAYDDDEQLTGLFTMIEDNLSMPFTTQVLGVEVTVRRVDLRHGPVVAICHRGRIHQAIAIQDLHLPEPSPPVPRGSRRTGTGRTGDPHGERCGR